MQSIYPRSDLATLPLIYILMCFDQFSSLIAILTLFIFVHMQSNCQGAISDAFNICVRRYPCMYLYCPHKYKSTHPITIGCKLIFMILNLIMINYITIAIIDEDYKQIWKDMHYVGHHICMLYFLLGNNSLNIKLNLFKFLRCLRNDNCQFTSANSVSEQKIPDSIRSHGFIVK